ncbi:MAG: 5,10-methylenetetrahydrofolate reductase [Nitrospiraceae bacterium]|nr:5,10-methylenetetrahydrofolate reductase [Nitrospiraceae bacterium]|tara:strand:+ start:3448 stop:4338 length:891 start_codon:yes stop_codon:yes gene_type:complete
MMNNVPRLREALATRPFVTTIEFNPPKGTDVSKVMTLAGKMVGMVDGVNVTDNTAAVLRAGSISLCRLLYEIGHDPVMQITCRDRNRLAIQSDLLSAHLLGIRNLLCLTGDYPTVGDHKDAKPVYDIDSIQMMQIIDGMNQGHDMNGKTLNGMTDLHVGAAMTPDMLPRGLAQTKFETKVNAGAHFFQTQAIFDAVRFKEFMAFARQFQVKVIAGIILLRSAKMARFLNDNIPGLSVPQDMVDELDGVPEDKACDVGIDLAVRTINAIRDSCDGVHLMTITAIDRLPELIKRAELR